MISKGRGSKSTWFRPLFFLFLCFGPFLGSLHAVEEQLNPLTVGNQTGFPLVQLYIRGETSSFWGFDLLSIVGEMAPGEEYRFYFHLDEQSAFFSAIAMDRDGDFYEIPRLELHRGAANTLVIDFDAFRGTLPNFTTTEVSIRNDSQRLVEYLFATTPESPHWGFDILGARGRFAPETEILFHVPVRRGISVYDLLGLDSRGEQLLRSVFIDDTRQQWFFSLGAQTPSGGT